LNSVSFVGGFLSFVRLSHREEGRGDWLLPQPLVRGTDLGMKVFNGEEWLPGTTRRAAATGQGGTGAEHGWTRCTAGRGAGAPRLCRPQARGGRLPGSRRRVHQGAGRLHPAAIK